MKKVNFGDDEVPADFINDLNETFIKAFKCRPQYAVLTENGDVMTCDLLTWARFMQAKQRIIAQEYLSGDYWLSTVFLGLDHGYDPRAPQLWFETMIFEPPTGDYSPITGRPTEHGNPIYCERFSTLKEALAGHRVAKCWFERQDNSDGSDNVPSIVR